MKTTEKILRELPDNWEKLILDFYGQGLSDSEIRAELGLTPKAWNLLYADTVNSNFQDLVEYGRDLCHAWWSKVGRTALDKKGFNTSLYVAFMQNQFDWNRKDAMADSAPLLSEEEVDQRLKAYLDMQKN